MAASSGVTCNYSSPGLGRSSADRGYDLSLNRTKDLVHEEVQHRPPLQILAELQAIEQEILQGIEELVGMLP